MRRLFARASMALAGAGAHAGARAYANMLRSAVALPAADLALEMAAPPSVSGTGPFDHAAEI
jgi:hypothetical protein